MFGSTSLTEQNKSFCCWGHLTLRQNCCVRTYRFWYTRLFGILVCCLYIFMAHHFPVLILSQHSGRHCRWQGFTPLHTVATDLKLEQLWRLLRSACSLRCLAGGNQWLMPCTFDLRESVSCLFLWYSSFPSGEYAHKDISEVLHEITTTILICFFSLLCRI